MPEAAESCEFTDDVTYECKMPSGNVFSDGSTLDAEDVVFSFERNVKIADPNGASSLLANMKSVEAPDKSTVVFNLAEPDATWPSVLATGVVRDRARPTASRPTSSRTTRAVIGSGRYTVEQYEPGQQTVLQANDRVQGRGPGADQHGDHPVLRQGLGAEAGGRAGRRRRRLPQPLADRPRGPEERRRRQRRPGRGRGDPLPQLQPRPAAGRRRRAEAGDPPGRRADDRPPVDRRQRLQRHRQAAVLDDPGEPPVPHRRVQGRVRGGPGRRRREQTLERRRGQDPGAARDLVDPVALRALLRRRVRGDQAPARRVAGSSR